MKRICSINIFSWKEKPSLQKVTSNELEAYSISFPAVFFPSRLRLAINDLCQIINSYLFIATRRKIFESELRRSFVKNIRENNLILWESLIYIERTKAL